MLQAREGDSLAPSWPGGIDMVKEEGPGLEFEYFP